jgi:hypothetical protein
MDAFESIVAQILEVAGYWTRIGFKVELTKAEKKALGNASMPRPELDIVAFKPATNELLIVECKSWLDSGGVDLRSFTVPTSQFFNRFKIFNDSKLSAVITRNLVEQLYKGGLLQNVQPNIKLVLAAGRIYSKDEPKLLSLFANRGWRLMTPIEISTAIRALASAGYQNDVMTIVTKILERRT